MRKKIKKKIIRRKTIRKRRIIRRIRKGIGVLA